MWRAERAGYQNARFQSSDSTLTDLYTLRRCAPTSCARRMPTPMIAQLTWGVEVLWRKRAQSYKGRMSI